MIALSPLGELRSERVSDAGAPYTGPIARVARHPKPLPIADLSAPADGAGLMSFGQ
jgi:hypothetical protein